MSDSFPDNYYSLPSIPCEQRKPLKFCSGINPNKVYATFFPGDANPIKLFEGPLSNKDVQKSGDFNAIGRTRHYLDKNQCAHQCIKTATCNIYTVQDNKPYALFYTTNKKNYSPETVEFLSMGTDIKVYVRNERKSVKCRTGCQSDISQNFDLLPKNYVPDGQTPYKRQECQSIEECMLTCHQDAKCQSFIYIDPKPICFLYDEKMPLQSVNKEGVDLYQKKIGAKESIIPEKYQKYYKDYPKGGNPGDYFCKYDDQQGCFKVKQTTCEDIPKKKSKKPVIPPVSKKAPLPPVCMPPEKCKNEDKKFNDAKVIINNFPIYEEQEVEPFTDPLRVRNVFTIGPYGYPLDQNRSNPPDGHLPYSKTYDMNANTKYVTCPHGYHACSHDKELCCSPNKIRKCVPIGEQRKDGYPLCDYESIPYVENAPKAKLFNNIDGCKNWCQNNPECYAVVRHIGNMGDISCRYYKYDTRNQKVMEMTTDLYTKRQFPYIANPESKILSGFRPDQKDLGCGLRGELCCPDGTRKIGDGSNCKPFSEARFRLTGDPFWQNSSLQGTTTLQDTRTDSGSSFLG